MEALATAVVALVCMVLVGGIVSPVAVAAADSVVVPAGTVFEVGDRFVAKRIVVEGTLASTGGDLVIVADLLTVKSGGVLRARDGVAAAPAAGFVAVGAPGEPGGAIRISAERFVVEERALVQSGSGGAGGSAVASLRAIGGAGGIGGVIDIRSPDVALLGVVIPGRGGDGGHAMASNGAGVGGASAGGRGGDSGQVFVNGQIVLRELPHLVAPASSALPVGSCMKPNGDPGGVGLANGGRGGDACSRGDGRQGEPGTAGSNGTFACTPGGNGGAGTAGAGGTSHGGAGGIGAKNGGAGGHADSRGIGGNGGGGGLGGKATFASNCAGGHGGRGGDAQGGTATGGEGGIGLCGRGGDGGTASGEGEAGAGGSGGSGSPPGEPGQPGLATPGAAVAGSAGFGLQVCQASLPDLGGGIGPVNLPELPWFDAAPDCTPFAAPAMLAPDVRCVRLPTLPPLPIT